jgi:hypothetical protein
MFHQPTQPGGHAICPCSLNTAEFADKSSVSAFAKQPTADVCAPWRWKYLKGRIQGSKAESEADLADLKRLQAATLRQKN